MGAALTAAYVRVPRPSLAPSLSHGGFVRSCILKCVAVSENVRACVSCAWMQVRILEHGGGFVVNFPVTSAAHPGMRFLVPDSPGRQAQARLSRSGLMKGREEGREGGRREGFVASHWRRRRRRRAQARLSSSSEFWATSDSEFAEVGALKQASRPSPPGSRKRVIEGVDLGGEPGKGE